jgi:lysophospholipase L1-like esterase
VLTFCLPAAWAAVNDFDGDGATDIAVFLDDAGNWYIRKSSDGNLLSAHWGWDGVITTPGDFDGNGRADYAVYDPNSGTWYGKRGDGTTWSRNWGWTGAVPVPADYDHDGFTDMAVYYPDIGNWYILRSSDQQGVIFNWGWKDAIPVPGDYDGDGWIDLGVFHPGSGYWYIFKSSDGKAIVFNWGWDGTEPVQADYDGDGITDIGIYHRDTGNWYIRRSGNGESLILNWGWSQAEAVPGDYNGDGFADIAVYDPGSDYWFIRYTAGATATIFWGDSGTVPTLTGYQVNQWFRPDDPPVQRKVYAAMGNGITSGSGDTIGDPWPPRLEDMLHRPVYNASDSGSRVCEYGVSHVDDVLDDYNPGYLLILYGSNDLTYGYSINDIISALRAMIREGHSRNVVVAVATLPPVFSEGSAPSWEYDQLNQQIRNLASSEDALLADVAAVFNGRRDLILDDGLHPTPEGQQLIAQTFYNVLP